MAVAKTGAMFKSLTFDGYSSRNYGVYITGEAVYNAPERAVEMISIPNRNGAFALDQGHFENIQVTYPAGVFADNEEDFADAISDFRNLLCSRKGYCTLTDEYHPDEYREAVYKSGLEVDPTQLRAGEFNITFECKPQRFLTSGNTPVTIANNGTITNPTLFDSHPLLAVKGYGTIMMNGYPIVLNDIPLGTIVLNEGWDGYMVGYDQTLVNNNDPLYLSSGRITLRASFSPKKVSDYSIGSVTYTKTNADFTVFGYGVHKAGLYEVNINTIITDASFTVGMTGSIIINVPVTFTFTDSSTTSHTYAFKYNYLPDGNGVYHFEFACSVDGGADRSLQGKTGTLTANSSVSALGNPTYIDCNIGEAYKIVNTDYVSLDNAVEIGSELPVLSSGSNTVTYDNTITELKVTPRWWKI